MIHLAIYRRTGADYVFIDRIHTATIPLAPPKAYGRAYLALCKWLLNPAFIGQNPPPAKHPHF